MLTRTLIITSAILLVGCTVKPALMTPEKIRNTVEQDKRIINQGAKPIAKPISLEDAIARALLNNRQTKLQKLESALAHGQFELAKYDMLPSLTTSAGYSLRSNYSGSGSVPFADGRPNGSPTSFSVSQGRKKETKDAVFAWNVLDFGLSYVRAKQSADMFLISRERERKVVHTITQDVRTAYWRAVSAERLLKKIGSMIMRTNDALEDSKTIESERLQEPLQALYYQRELLEIMRSLQSLRMDLANAKIELAELMGVKPGVKFTLKDVDNSDFQVPDLPFDLAVMEDMAFNNRPELMESYYQKRISAAETRAAVLKMLPGINLTAGRYHDNNEFLLNQDWTSLGAQVSWNLLNVFRISDEQNIANTREALAEQQRLATSMAVLTQVHLAKKRYEQTKKDFSLSNRYHNVANRILGQVENQAETDSSPELDLIRESLNALVAELRRDIAYAELQNSFGRIFVTMGLDLVKGGYSNSDIETLSSSIKERFIFWNEGHLVNHPSAY